MIPFTLSTYGQYRVGDREKCHESDAAGFHRELYHKGQTVSKATCDDSSVQHRVAQHNLLFDSMVVERIKQKLN
jgi:hypothetical protein